MGGLISTAHTGELNQEWMDVFSAMKFKRSEVLRLHKVFVQIDYDNTGLVDVANLLILCDIKRTILTERTFSAFEKDHAGKIDFYEFVVLLWKFCTLDSSAIALFAFDIYDEDADGILSTTEALRMYDELVSSKINEHDTTKLDLIALTHGPQQGFVGIEEFRHFCRTHQAFLFPVFAVQNKLKVACLGASFWDSLSQRRIQLRPGYTVPLAELMVLHSDRKLFRQLLEDQTVMSVSAMMKTVLQNTDCGEHHYVPKLSMSAKLRSHLASMVSSAAQQRDKYTFKSKAKPKLQDKPKHQAYHIRRVVKVVPSAGSGAADGDNDSVDTMFADTRSSGSTVRSTGSSSNNSSGGSDAYARRGSDCSGDTGCSVSTASSYIRAHTQAPTTKAQARARTRPHIPLLSLPPTALAYTLNYEDHAV